MVSRSDQYRLGDLERFYSVLADLEDRVGGTRTLGDCHGRMGWPLRGVYFFFEQGEHRSQTGDGPRVVRVGTHALKDGSRTTLWNRLSQHRGQARHRGGNHRGSIFRSIVGRALIEHEGLTDAAVQMWGQGSSAPREVREGEQAHEQRVSAVIGAMPFLWVAVDDPPGPGSLRGLIERNSIALLSGFNRPPIDPSSASWLGRHCDRERVRLSGLWNSNHVDEQHDPAFLDTLARCVATTPAVDDAR